MTSDSVGTNIGGSGLMDRETDESWELLKREFNTLFSNLRIENKAEHNLTDNERETTRKPIILQDRDDSNLLNQRSDATITGTAHDRCFNEVSDSLKTKKNKAQKIQQVKLIFNSLEGKEVCSKIIQHTLSLLSLLLWRKKIRVPDISSKVRSVILQLSLFRYCLRFGNFAVNVYRIIKQFRQLREMKKSHYQERPFLIFLRKLRFRDIIETLYNLTDELILFHKLQSMFTKKNMLHVKTNRLMRCIKKQHYVLWEILNILAINKNIQQWQQLIRDEIYLSMFNTSGNFIKDHYLEYELLTNNKNILKLQKNNITLDFYKIILNLMSNLINIKGKRKQFNLGLAYEIITAGSGIIELVELWNQAKVTLMKQHTSAV